MALAACKGDTFVPSGAASAGRGGSGQAGTAAGAAGASAGSGGQAGAAAGLGGNAGSAAGTLAAGGEGGVAGEGGSMGGSPLGGAAGNGGAAGKGSGGVGGKAGPGGQGGQAGKGEGGAGGQPPKPRLHDAPCDGTTPNGKNACGQECSCSDDRWTCNATRGDTCTEIVGAVCDSVAGRCLCRLGFTYCPPASGEGQCDDFCDADGDLYYACRRPNGSMTTCTCLASKWTCT